MGMTENTATGHLIITGTYEDVHILGVVVGTLEQAQKVADQLNLDLIRSLSPGESLTKVARVEDTATVYTFGGQA